MCRENSDRYYDMVARINSRLWKEYICIPDIYEYYDERKEAMRAYEAINDEYMALKDRRARCRE
jgi:hypothetical protein